ncbi:SDR family NAD(P)-dependent oxidoreductase [Runella sp.]|uniref:SDR family oxidoreductase n=1 Tax=Runella sp. TaxID=1960881 RepID=UPI003015C84E
MRTTGNTILITGGTSGIGLELVGQFYELGNSLIVASSNEANLRNLKERFAGIETIQCDLADSQSVKNLVDTCLEKYPNINIINNAGVQYNYSFLEEKKGYHKIASEIGINLISPFQITYGLLPLLLQKPEAAIVNVSSGLAFAPKKSAPIYCATKAAIHNGTKALRYQLENTSVKVFEIIPALVSTPMTEGRGKGKITPKQLVDEFMHGFAKDKFEISIGKTKLLRLIQRLAPALADRIMKNGL